VNIESGTRQAGFSLLEVLVAFAIATLCLAMLSQIFGQNVRHMDLSRNYVEAAALAENLMARYGQPREWEGQSFADSSDRFNWQVTIEPYEIPREDDDAFIADPDAQNDTVHLVQIGVAVDWTQLGKTRSVALKSLRVVTAEPADKRVRNTL
jgi:general secretion pathway protein I